jgi:hypothetical protein
MVLIGFVFMGFVATSAWILFGRDFFATVRTRLTEEEKEPEKSEE